MASDQFRYIELDPHTTKVLSNWSGRGQHVDFKAEEDIPYQLVRELGKGAHGTVSEVRCQGVLLAKKPLLGQEYTGALDAVYRLDCSLYAQKKIGGGKVNTPMAVEGRKKVLG